MSALENVKGKFKHFRPTTWSIKNKTSIYLVMLFVSVAGIFQFITLPKEIRRYQESQRRKRKRRTGHFNSSLINNLLK